MTMKSVEIQIALPRTHDAGKLQEQLQQRGQLQNELAAQESKKEEQLKQSGIIRKEHKDIARFHDQRSRGEQPEQQRKINKKRNKGDRHHPYKGRMLDIRG